MLYSNVAGYKEPLSFRSGEKSIWIAGAFPAAPFGLYIHSHQDVLKICFYGDESRVDTREFKQYFEECLDEII